MDIIFNDYNIKIYKKCNKEIYYIEYKISDVIKRKEITKAQVVIAMKSVEDAAAVIFYYQNIEEKRAKINYYLDSPKGKIFSDYGIEVRYENGKYYLMYDAGHINLNYVHIEISEQHAKMAMSSPEKASEVILYYQNLDISKKSEKMYKLRELAVQKNEKLITPQDMAEKWDINEIFIKELVDCNGIKEAATERGKVYILESAERYDYISRLANELQIKEETLQKKCETGEIKGAYNIGGIWLIPCSGKLV